MRGRRIVTRVLLVALAAAILLGIGGLLANGALSKRTPGLGRRLIVFLTTNVAETSAMPEFPELAMRRYSMEREQLLQALRAAVVRLGWRIVSEETDGSGLDAVAVTPLLRFRDDVQIRLRGSSSGAWQVHIRSRSRLGKIDLGANLRHIQDLNGALAVELAGVSPRSPGRGP